MSCDCAWCEKKSWEEFFRNVFVTDGNAFLRALKCMEQHAFSLGHELDARFANKIALEQIEEDCEDCVYFLRTEFHPVHGPVYKVGRTEPSKGKKQKKSSLWQRYGRFMFVLNLGRYATYLFAPDWKTLVVTDDAADLEQRILRLLHRATWVIFPEEGGREKFTFNERVREDEPNEDTLDDHQDFFDVLCRMALGHFGPIPQALHPWSNPMDQLPPILISPAAYPAPYQVAGKF